MNEVTLMVQLGDAEVARVHSELQKDVAHLAERLARLSKRLEQDGIESRVNDYGEVQGAGLDIDRHCAQLNAARAKRDLLRTIVERMGSTR
jgi:hypothetical protein